MPLVEKTVGGSVYLRGIDERLTAGDRVDVSEEFAEYLLEERGDFKRVDVQDAEFREIDADDEEESDGDEPDEADGFDVGEFLDDNVDPIVEDIHAGEADEHLDAVAEASDRVTINDAVGERRAELETEE